MSLNNVFDQLEKEGYGQREQESEWLKLKEGRNRIRVMTLPEPVPSHFKYGYCLGKECTFKDEKGEHPKASIKFLAWVWSYDEKELRLANLAYSIASQIRTLENDPDYAFETYPMPFDVTINVKGAGTKEVEYGLIASPKREDPLPEATKAMEKKKSTVDIKDAMKKKKMKELGIEVEEVKVVGAVDYPKDDIKPEDIPW
jgi:hypothetical protein